MDDAPIADSSLFALEEPPNNIELEAVLLGALLRNNATYDSLRSKLHPEHFYSPEHGRIFEAIQSNLDTGREATPTLLKSFADSDDLISKIGGYDYLIDLAANPVSLKSTANFVDVIIDLHKRREIVRICEDFRLRAISLDNLDDDSTAQCEDLERELSLLGESGSFDQGLSALKSHMDGALEAIEAALKQGGTLGLPSGFRDIDRITGGFHKGEMTILAGRPAMGKSAKAMTIALLSALSGEPVAFFSLEMSGLSIASRLLASETGFSATQMRRGQISTDEFANSIMPAAERLGRLPLMIDDTAGLTVFAIRNRARRMKRRHGLSLIVVDYLQIMGEDRGSRMNRVDVVSGFSRGLRDIARELDVPILVLSQLSRNVENREDKRPKMADLRDSGAIEQDADSIFLLYREEYYLEKEEPTEKVDEKPETFQARYERWKQRMTDARGLAEVIIAKQRHGPTGTVELEFEAKKTMFRDLDRECVE